jgi:hypothetical protein
MAKTDHRYVLGKVDYYGNGRANCEAAITWSLENGRFSMCAEIWMPSKRDIECGGQCVDTVAAYFPEDAKAQRMLAIWREWHLNDMTAGSPAQNAHLKTLGAYQSYDWALMHLAAVGLNPDPNYRHNGKPYHYGSAWLKRELPADVVAEINSWST